MCHTLTSMPNSSAEQIERFLQQGLPKKAVRSVVHVLKKRAAATPSHTDSDIECSTCSSSEEECQCTTPTNTRPGPAPVAAAPAGILRCPFTANIMKLQLPAAGSEQHQAPIANLGSHVGDKKSGNTEVYVDMLAVGTQLTKQFFELLMHAALQLQHTRIYTLMTRTTQPAHIAAIGILSLVLAALWPDLFVGSSSSSGGGGTGPSAGRRPQSTLAAIAYLGAFATHFGAQIWMTFVSGLSLYFSLPRHTFGQCQQILFPRYFALNAVLSIGMLILFIKYFHSGDWNSSSCVQLCGLALSAVIEVTVRLYLAPPMLRLMLEKYRIEDAIGSGKEVGTLAAGDLVQCPHYQRIHKAFRRIHMTVAMGNMLVLATTCLQLYYLAARIQIAT